MFDERSLPESYENRAYDEDRNLPSVITMPDTTIDNLPKVRSVITMLDTTIDNLAKVRSHDDKYF